MNLNNIEETQQKRVLTRLVHTNIENSTVEELQQVLHVLESLRSAKEDGGLHYLGQFLGIERIVEENHVYMHLGLQNANTYGVAQGGALYTLADVAIGYKVIDTLSEGQKVFTLELKINYIKKGSGAKLIAKPKILHLGGKTIVGECSIEDESGSLIAQALGTFIIVNS
ncbi:PaaI family thioesterase [Anaerobacillus sp. MEB173]|uniref:PaaI family thioesterase n=1 Tax=Anaerobacillus sp. MEB173 TaxID=3383345 RepID=UPI003F935BE8